MNIDQKTNKYLHQKLPINDDEVILGIYRHHWFAYASIWFIGIFLVIAIMGLAILVMTEGGGDIQQYKTPVIAGAGVLSVFVLVFTFVPVWLRSQEQVVLTEEAVLQMLQPSLFASKVSQLNLRHVADVSVRQDFFGTIFGFGKVTVETPGEQDNYEFTVMSDPHQVSKSIIMAHENFQAALESGRMPSTLSSLKPEAAAAPAIDPAQYNQFLQYQQMVQQQAAQQPPVVPQDGTEVSAQPAPAAAPAPVAAEEPDEAASDAQPQPPQFTPPSA